MTEAINRAHYSHSAHSDLPKLTDSDYEEDSGDENHMDNFVSLSDDEKTVNEKQARAEYNFRERVRKKRKNRSKPYEKN